MPVTPPFLVILTLAVIGAAAPCLLAALTRSDSGRGLVIQGVLTGLWTASVSSLSLLGMEWIDWSLRDHAAWATVQREFMVEHGRSDDGLRYIQASDDLPPPGVYHPELVRDTFRVDWAEVVSVGAMVGAFAGLLVMGVGWVADRISGADRMTTTRRTLRGVGVMLVVTAALVWIPAKWRPFEIPSDAEVALRHDLGEAYAGDGPFKAMSTADLIDRVYPQSGEQLWRMSVEWATLYRRYEARRLSQPEWEELLRRHFRTLAVIWLPRTVPARSTVWVRLGKCPWLSGEGRTFEARIEAKLEDSTPFEARWGNGIVPKRSWPVGRAPERADHLDFVVSIREIGGELQTRLNMRLPVAVGGPMDASIALTDEADVTAWVQRNVDLRLDRRCIPPLVFAHRLPAAMTFPGAAEPLGVGLSIEFQHDGRPVARAMAWAQAWSRPEPPGHAFAVAGAVEELLSADPTDPRWRVVVSGNADLALSEIDAASAWVGSFSMPLADLKSP